MVYIVYTIFRKGIEMPTTPATSSAKKAPAAAKKTAAKAAKTKKPAVASSDVKKPVAADKKSPKQAASKSKAAAPAVKPKKTKLVRDSFTMPENEYQVLRDLKKACLKAGVDVKKSELLRIGVALIKSMDPAAVKAAVARLAPLKAGRPKKSAS
jgi:hypothetical protein